MADVARDSQRADVIEALRVLSDSDHQARWLRGEATSPSLTDAVHWLVDDTWLDTKSAIALVPDVFADAEEAAAVDAAVTALIIVLDALGPMQPDREYLEHPGWRDVVSASRQALALLAV